MTSPLISVIINNYNYGAFLARAVQSALDQRDVRAEVIVVDDGSSDDSRAVINSFGDQIVAVFQANAGQAAAINTGVRYSKGEILCFLDADDWFTPDKLAATAAAFARDPRIGLVYNRLQPVHPDGSDAFAPIPRSLCQGDLAALMARSGGRWPFPMTSAVSVRRSLWQRIGDIPDSFRISADAWLVGIYPFFARVAALPEVLGFYLIHANNWYRAQDDAEMLQKRMAHWAATVAASNEFLTAHDLPHRLELDDHFPYQVARARLEGAAPSARLDLLWNGLRDPGEPNLARRIRDCLRAMQQVSSAGMGGADPVRAR
ncbi:glycosyltransferase [Thioclava sp. 15-R06ZXC-3]|uniref:Glycosyltransferase n=1 Tax=Thioclava arctica TaxID=3238301 RepID=A0ABV3THX1_9RHOB